MLDTFAEGYKNALQGKNWSSSVTDIARLAPGQSDAAEVGLNF